MATNYRNYRRLKKILGAKGDNFTIIMNEFLAELRKFNQMVKNNVHISKFKQFDPKFLDKMKQLTPSVVRSNTVSDRFFIARYLEFYARNKTLPYVSIELLPYPKSVDDYFYREKLAKSLDYLGEKITPYDEELFKFNNMLDEYQEKLNAYPLDLGKVSVDMNTYTWKAEKIKDSVDRYYKEFFDDDINKVVKHYIDGLIWVFEYYFNSYGKYIDNENIWYYKYEKAPLLTQIYDYIKRVDDNYLQERLEYLKKQVIDRENYFNCLEHLMYVSPAPLLIDMMPKEYHNFIKKSGWYPDFKKLIKNAWDIIDCRGAIFMSKCSLEIPPNKKTDQEFIKELRKIELNPETAERKCEYIKSLSNVKIFTYGKVTKLNMINNQETLDGGYRYYKQRYLETRVLDYKKVYKAIKNHLRV